MATLRLQRFVVLVTGLVVGIVIALVAISIYRERQLAIAKAELSTRNIALTLEEQTRRVFEANRLLLLHVARLLKGRDWDSIAADRNLHDELARLAQSPHVHSIWGFDEHGIGRLSSRFYPALPSNVTDRDYFVAQKTADVGFFVGRLIRGKSTDDAVFSTSIRLAGPDGSFRGVVVIFTRPDYFVEFYRSIDLGSAGVFELLYTDGSVLAGEPNLPDAAGRGDIDLLPQIARQGSAGTYRAVWSRDGIERISSFRQLDGLHVIVNVATSVTSVLKAWRLTEVPVLIGNGVAVLAICTLGVLLVVRLREAERFAEVLDKRVKHRTRQLETSNQSLHLLLKEVHHRVKNNLQVISSMLRIQLRRVPAELQPAFVDTFGRIQAMSMIHEQIYGSRDLAAIDFGVFIRQLADTLRRSQPAGQRVTVEVQADKMRFNLDQATPLALIVNEIVTNAFKHAFPRDAAGRITVALSREDDRVRLVIQDNGIGLPPDFAERNGSSFGITLVDRLCEQVSGEWAIASHDGTRFTLSFAVRPTQNS